MVDSVEIEHDPWEGLKYQMGIDEQRIAIVGYSHHRAEDDHDTRSFTRDVINDVLARDSHQFFRSIRAYFAFEDARDFWSRVLFFNFLPDCIGTTDRRYADGTTQQIKRGQGRVKRLMGTYRPHKTLIFTHKGWREFPPTREEASGKACPLLAPEFGRFSWGTYDVGGFVVVAFGLRHPQYASSDMMRKVVQHILAMPIVNG